MELENFWALKKWLDSKPSYTKPNSVYYFAANFKYYCDNTIEFNGTCQVSVDFTAGLSDGRISCHPDNIENEDMYHWSFLPKFQTMKYSPDDKSLIIRGSACGTKSFDKYEITLFLP